MIMDAHNGCLGHRHLTSHHVWPRSFLISSFVASIVAVDLFSSSRPLSLSLSSHLISSPLLMTKHDRKHRDKKPKNKDIPREVEGDSHDQHQQEEEQEQEQSTQTQIQNKQQHGQNKGQPNNKPGTA